MIKDQASLLRDITLTQVSENAGTWMDRAKRALPALRGQTMTGEMIRLYLSEIIGEPHHHNAYGALINHAVRSGQLKPTGRYLKMRTKKSHARKTPEYLIQ